MFGEQTQCKCGCKMVRKDHPRDLTLFFVQICVYISVRCRSESGATTASREEAQGPETVMYPLAIWSIRMPR